jgi:hypothetical protein
VAEEPSGGNGALDVRAIRESVAEFDSILRNVVREREREQWADGYREDQLDHHWCYRWDLVALVDSYLTQKRYPEARLRAFVDYMFDIKLQLYYLIEILAGLPNWLAYSRGFDHARPRDNPRLLLAKLALDQTLIGASRILWERIMNAVYYLETGEELEDKVSNRKSKKSAFFDHIRNVDAWKPLLAAQDLLTWYDASFRTGEFHKSSFLRAVFLGHRALDDNDLLDPLNTVLNGVWETIFAAVQGTKPPLSLGGSPRWLPPLPGTEPDNAGHGGAAEAASDDEEGRQTTNTEN